jgi:PucR C-terminal helix-turn-helix domain/GGDEF-like domain
VAADPTRSRVSGWILALADVHSGWSAARQSVVDELAGVIALEMVLSVRRPEAQVQLVRALIGSSAADVEQAVRRIGWDAGDPAVVVVADGAEAASVLGEAFATEPDPVAFSQQVGLVRTRDPAALAARLRATVDFLSPGLGRQMLRIGVSDAVTGGAGLLGAVAEARAALETSTGPHTVAGPERLSSHAVLLAAVPVELRDAYRRRVLGPMLEHDRAHRTDLVRTLEAYLESSGSWSRCAARMHLHVNTVRYRIERIEALTGRDLRRLEDQADLLLALRLPPTRA